MLKTVGFPSSSTGDQTIINGNLVIGTAGKGIDFSADPSAPGMTSELLDDYEEGTFTPTIIGNSTSGVGTYTAQFGSYTKIGNRVFFSINIAWSAHTGTGYILVDGLPFTITNNNANLAAIATYLAADTALSAGKILQTRTVIGASRLLPTQYSTGGTGVAVVNITASGGFYLTGYYYV